MKTSDIQLSFHFAKLTTFLCNGAQSPVLASLTSKTSCSVDEVGCVASGISLLPGSNASLCASLSSASSLPESPEASVRAKKVDRQHGRCFICIQISLPAKAEMNFPVPQQLEAYTRKKAYCQVMTVRAIPVASAPVGAGVPDFQ